jgi:hypothetical protein
MERGYTVLTPFGENCAYDFVLDDDGKLSRVQVKTGRLEDGKVKASLSRTHVNAEGCQRSSYDEGSIDAFVIHAPAIDETYWVDADEAGKTQINIRVEPPADRQATNPNINWAENFSL